jgi:UDP-N-acetylglucosamine acyltransferase
MLGGGAIVSSDIAPYCLAAGRNTLIGLNIVGLRRRGFTRETLQEIKRAFHALDVPVGNRRALATACLASGEFKSPEARNFLEFFQGGKRSFARTQRGGTTSPADSGSADI